MGGLAEKIGQGLRPPLVLAHPFDPRSGFIYSLFLSLVALIILSFAVFDYSITADTLRRLPVGAVVIAVCGMTLRRYGHPRLGGAVEVTGLTYLQGVATVFLLFPLTAISLPFADPLFATIDEALGFHWPSFATLFATGSSFALLKVVYYSFEWQSLIIVPLLFAFGHDTRAWRFVTAAAIAAVLTMAIYPFAPAQGPAVHYGLQPSDYPNFGMFPWEFGPKIAAIKNAGGFAITPDRIFAMVSMPSYHAFAAVLFMWALWPLRKFRWLAVALNFAMLVATIVVGVHYLTDLIGGMLVAVAAIWAAKYTVRDRNA